MNPLTFEQLTRPALQDAKFGLIFTAIPSSRAGTATLTLRNAVRETIGLDPLKRGHMNRLQTFSRETGRFVKDTGLTISKIITSDATNFTGGVSLALAENAGASGGIKPIGKAGRLGHFLGRLIDPFVGP